MQRVEQVLERNDIKANTIYMQEGRVVIRFNSTNDQADAVNIFRDTFSADSNVAPTVAPNTPEWVRRLGLNPMSLGLDLRGGVYVLLEVDMNSASESRLVAYEQDFADRLRDQRIRSRPAVDGKQIMVPLRSTEDLERAREIIEE